MHACTMDVHMDHMVSQRAARDYSGCVSCSLREQKAQCLLQKEENEHKILRRESDLTCPDLGLLIS